MEDKKYGLSVSRTPDLIVITKGKQEVVVNQKYKIVKGNQLDMYILIKHH